MVPAAGRGGATEFPFYLCSIRRDDFALALIFVVSGISRGSIGRGNSWEARVVPPPKPRAAPAGRVDENPAGSVPALIRLPEHLAAESSSVHHAACAAYTIDEFCNAHRISRSKLYELWSRGKGPRFIQI
jgi:hypothetical protein